MFFHQTSSVFAFGICDLKSNFRGIFITLGKALQKWGLNQGPLAFTFVGAPIDLDLNDLVNIIRA